MGNQPSEHVDGYESDGIDAEPDNRTLDEYWNEVDGALPRQVTAVIIGGGIRGVNYANFALDFPSRLKIVGIAERNAVRRQKVQTQHEIPDEHAVDDWKKLSALDKLADLAIITTPVDVHKDAAITFAEKGYHLLLEDPMAVQESDCEEIAEACKKNKVMAGVCNVLRYFPPCVKIRQIIDSGVLGDIVTVNHHNNILYWHFVHTYVRGNWGKTAKSASSFMANCCQDIDLITYWMGNQKCKSIQSFGDLFHFKSSQKPQGATMKCFECPVEKACPYSAQKIYLSAPNDSPRWPMSVVCDIEDHPSGYKSALEEALVTGPYGRCVYECDNDVCDHQTVSMKYETGATVTVTMNAFTKNLCRETKICGTRGELRWDGSANHALNLFLFATEESKRILPDSVAPRCRTRGHAGADFFLMNSTLKAIANNDSSYILSNATESLRSHKLIFLAEKSRLNGSVELVN